VQIWLVVGVSHICYVMQSVSIYVRDGEHIELSAGDEVEFSLSRSSTKAAAESIRKLKIGTILSLVCNYAYVDIKTSNYL